MKEKKDIEDRIKQIEVIQIFLGIVTMAIFFKLFL